MVSSKSANLGEFMFSDSIFRQKIGEFILRNEKFVKNFETLVPLNKKKFKLIDSPLFIKATDIRFDTN